MHSRDTIDLHDNSHRNIKIITQLTQVGYAILCYSILSTKVYAAVQQSSWIFPAFGIFAAIFIFKAGLYLYDLIHAKNKNIGKFAAFAREFIAASVFTLAIVTGFLSGTALGALSPIFLVASQVVYIIFHSITAIYMKYRACKATDPVERELFQASFKRHSINALFFIVGTACLSLMATHIPLLIVGVINAAYNAFCFAIIAYTSFKIYRNNKHLIKEIEQEVDVNQETPLIKAESQNKHFYYFHKNRNDYLNEAVDAKEYLFAEIDAKIQKLMDEIAQSKKDFFHQKNKRQAKILSLQKLRKLLGNPFTTIHDFNNLLKEPLFHAYFNNPFQSFFRQTGDTVDIFDAAKQHFLNKKLDEPNNDLEYLLV